MPRASAEPRAHVISEVDKIPMPLHLAKIMAIERRGQANMPTKKKITILLGQRKWPRQVSRKREEAGEPKKRHRHRSHDQSHMHSNSNMQEPAAGQKPEGLGNWPSVSCRVSCVVCRVSCVVLRTEIGDWSNGAVYFSFHHPSLNCTHQTPHYY